MCEACGCGDTGIVALEVHEKILAGNERAAGHNREHFAAHGVFVANLMGSPGSGKTAVLEATARAWGATRRDAARRVAAISGDLATDHDARRLSAAGIPCVPITTGSACHLDADLVHRALHDVRLDEVDVLFIENVGNLVCPAVYDLGQAVNVVALSITEGEDKPLKYPVMFAKADLVLLTKIDLLPHLPEICIERVAQALTRVMPAAALLPLSARTGEGVDRWLEWLRQRAAGVFAADAVTPA